MNRTAFACALGLIWAGAALAADPVEGMWKTNPDDDGNYGLIEIQPCGPAYCGTLRQAFDSSDAIMNSPNIGKMIVWDMVAQGSGAYGSGKIWSPDRDKTYSARMSLNGDGLAVKGCVFGICRDGGTWTRVK
jgi:uncharacterized protein (DUF2147 family)